LRLWVFSPVIAVVGLHSRHCEEPQGLERGATKQSPNDKRWWLRWLLNICRLEIASSPHAFVSTAPRNDGAEDPQS